MHLQRKGEGRGMNRRAAGSSNRNSREWGQVCCSRQELMRVCEGVARLLEISTWIIAIRELIVSAATIDVLQTKITDGYSEMLTFEGLQEEFVIGLYLIHSRSLLSIQLLLSLFRWHFRAILVHANSRRKFTPFCPAKVQQHPPRAKTAALVGSLSDYRAPSWYNKE